MRHRVWLLMALAGTAIAVVAGVVIAGAIRRDAKPKAVAAQAPELRIAESDLHFGDVWEQQDFVWPVTVENTSASPKQITGFSGSCSCQTISPREFTLQPGESRRVEVRLDLRANNSQALAEPVDDFAVAFWATVKGESKDISWKLTGRVKRAVRCPDRVDLGRVSEWAPEKGAVEFGVRPFAELSRFRIVPGAAWVRTELKRVGGNYAVKVIPESGLCTNTHPLYENPPLRRRAARIPGRAAAVNQLSASRLGWVCSHHARATKCPSRIPRWAKSAN